MNSIDRILTWMIDTRLFLSSCISWCRQKKKTTTTLLVWDFNTHPISFWQRNACHFSARMVSVGCRNVFDNDNDLCNIKMSWCDFTIVRKSLWRDHRYKRWMTFLWSRKKNDKHCFNNQQTHMLIFQVRPGSIPSFHIGKRKKRKLSPDRTGALCRIVFVRKLINRQTWILV